MKKPYYTTQERSFMLNHSDSPVANKMLEKLKELKRLRELKFLTTIIVLSLQLFVIKHNPFKKKNK